MIRITCYCSCGASHWTQDFENGSDKFTYHEGISDDCPQCDNQKGSGPPDVSFERAMKNVTPLRPKKGAQ